MSAMALALSKRRMVEVVATSRVRGHPVRWDSCLEVWRYSSDGAIAYAEDRVCSHCGDPATADGHDSCISSLAEAENACCGHGDTVNAYVQFRDGHLIRGSDAVRYFHEHDCGILCTLIDESEGE